MVFLVEVSVNYFWKHSDLMYGIEKNYAIAYRDIRVLFVMLKD